MHRCADDGARSISNAERLVARGYDPHLDAAAVALPKIARIDAEIHRAVVEAFHNLALGNRTLLSTTSRQWKLIMTSTLGRSLR